MTSKVRQLYDFDQSVWYDNLSRELLLDGTLWHLVSQGEISGVTTNPSILKKAFAESRIYDPAIEAAGRDGAAVDAVYQDLIVEDIRLAADLLSGVYRSSAGRDGYVSIEVSPHLASDAAGTVKEAKELFRLIDRPNILIKIPATAAGLQAIETLIAGGVNVNVTLLFSPDLYQQAARAYISGLQRRAEAGRPVDGIASVASFFVSRWDTLVDGLLDQAAAEGRAANGSIAGLRGNTAIAITKEAYRRYRQIFESEGWLGLAAKGARPQRLLFASTGTKDPRYSDVYYVEGLIAPGTVTTLPPKTLAAFRDHGRAALAAFDDLSDSRVLAALGAYEIDLPSLADQLLGDGLTAFVKAYDDLLQGLGKKING